MVADELALDLVRRYLPKGGSVLDPFCGSGRLLVAADEAALRVGTDANPLAVLLTKAKLATVAGSTLVRIIDDLKIAQRRFSSGIEILNEGRRVEWFSPLVLCELGRIVAFLNALFLDEDDRLLVAAALSATVREVSYARQAGWKLHRRSPAERSKLNLCPWERLECKLRYCLAEKEYFRSLSGRHLIDVSTIDAFRSPGHPARQLGPYDLVVTSPPYGDSRSTVQYGATSALCLSVVSRIRGLEELAVTGGNIDAQCLGGMAPSETSEITDVSRYWSGSLRGQHARLVKRFLSQYSMACEAISNCVRPDGTAVLVVGRRSTGGRRLRLDDFTVECLQPRGLELIRRTIRRMKQKRLPTHVNRFARSASNEKREKGLVPTMKDEIVLVFRKQ